LRLTRCTPCNIRYRVRVAHAGWVARGLGAPSGRKVLGPRPETSMTLAMKRLLSSFQQVRRSMPSFISSIVAAMLRAPQAPFSRGGVPGRRCPALLALAAGVSPCTWHR